MTVETSEPIEKPRDHRAILWLLAVTITVALALACLAATFHHKRSLYDVWRFGDVRSEAFRPAKIEDISRYFSWYDLLPLDWRGPHYFYLHSEYRSDWRLRRALQTTLRFADGTAAIYRTRLHWNTCPLRTLEVGRSVDVYSDGSGGVVVRQCLDTARQRVPYILMCALAFLPLSALSWRLWRMR